MFTQQDEQLTSVPRPCRRGVAWGMDLQEIQHAIEGLPKDQRPRWRPGSSSATKRNGKPRSERDFLPGGAGLALIEGNESRDRTRLLPRRAPGPGVLGLALGIGANTAILRAAARSRVSQFSNVLWVGIPRTPGPISFHPFRAL